MLNSSGFLIRFIDIGLILLLGFLWISDISTFTQIEMPNEEEEQQSTEQTDTFFLKVQVLKGGEFTLVEMESQEVLCSEVPRPDLEECLRTARDRIQGEEARPVVLIEPIKASAVQHTVDAMDICDRLGIPKSISKSKLQL